MAQADTNTESKPKRTGAVKKAPSDKKKNTPSSSNALSQYLRETRGEMRKVTWPTQDEAWRLTGIVLAVTIAFSIFLGLLDFLWSNGLEYLIRLLIGQA